MIRDVIYDAARGRSVEDIVGRLCDGVSKKVLVRAFQYWRNIDEQPGKRNEKGVREKLGGASDAPGMASAETTQELEPAE